MRGRISFAVTVVAMYLFVAAVTVGTWITGANRRTKKTCHS